ncbi:MAG TPA: transketolase [Planctomycetes bacterium]|nr:transketolase [Planctomycetota bacterium]
MNETVNSESSALEPSRVEKLSIDAIRILSMDAVQKANSGHPGTPMALAPLAYILFTRHLRHNPKNPDWAGRDRFVLSCGHASMLLYSTLYLSGYDLSLEDIKDFRQWGSKTPGHPEYGHTPGVETTTGPLGQGVGMAVGMAVAEAHLSTRFNRTGHYVVDHHTYFVASDGDLMEGISHEAASLAGHLKLGKLIGFWDDNEITIEGSRSLADGDLVEKRFESYGWHVISVEDVNDLNALDDAIEAARAELLRPSLIRVRSHIGYGSPNKQDKAAAHGAPLGEEEVRLTRENLGWEWEEPFYVPEEVLEHWRHCLVRGEDLEEGWKQEFKTYQKAYPAEAEELLRCESGQLPEGWEKSLPDFSEEVGKFATRSVSGTVLNALAPKIPELVGGSADLGPSNNTQLKGVPDFEAGSLGGRNFHFGIREHGMGAIMNGMLLHKGLRPYGGTFLVFSDYMKPAIRLAALMKLPAIYVFTHDSIGLGEDGPTHQPVEHIAALRLIPGVRVFRPCDPAETGEAWKHALLRSDGPTALVLTRQKLPALDRSLYARADGLAKGAYVLLDPPSQDPALVLLASGSEVSLTLEAAKQLEKDGVPVRVVSVPSLDLFLSQEESYRREVLLSEVPRLAVEAASPMPWYQVLGDKGAVIGLDRFGASAPAERLFEEFGFTPAHVVQRAKTLLG